MFLQLGVYSNSWHFEEYLFEYRLNCSAAETETPLSQPIIIIE